MGCRQPKTVATPPPPWPHPHQSYPAVTPQASSGLITPRGPPPFLPPLHTSRLAPTGTTPLRPLTTKWEIEPPPTPLGRWHTGIPPILPHSARVFWGCTPPPLPTAGGNRRTYTCDEHPSTYGGRSLLPCFPRRVDSDRGGGIPSLSIAP